MRTRPPPATAWAVIILATLLACGAGFISLGEGGLIAWRNAVLLLTGQAAGSLIVLAAGHLLANDWVEAVRDELEPAAWTIVPLAVLALPLTRLAVPDAPAIIPADLMTDARQSWFHDGAIFVRTCILFGGLAGLSIWVSKAGERRFVSAIALAIAAIFFAIGSADWLLLSRPFWWSTLIPFALLVNQMSAALALGFISNLVQREKGDEHAFRSLASGLLALALLSLWVWFSVYLIAWFGNQPDEAGWFLHRMRGTGTLLLGIWLSGNLLGVAILMFSRRRRWSMTAASAGMLAGYIAGMLWLLYPAGLRPLALSDLIPIGVLAGLWLVWLALGQRYYDAAHSGSRSASVIHARSSGSEGGQRSSSPSSENK